MTFESEKNRLLQERSQNDNPELAAEAATHRFERNAIAVPDVLMVPDGAPKWQRRLYFDAGRLYKELVVAEPRGHTLTGLRAAATGMGQVRFDEALRFLRASGATSESRREPGGFDVDQIALRVTP